MKLLDWWIAGIITALVLMAEYRLVFYGDFEPFPVSADIALLLLARSVINTLRGSSLNRAARG